MNNKPDNNSNGKDVVDGTKFPINDQESRVEKMIEEGAGKSTRSSKATIEPASDDL